MHQVQFSQLRFQKPVHCLYRAVDCFHKQPTDHFGNQDFFAVFKFNFASAASRKIVGIISRAYDFFALIQKRDDFTLVPDVIAGTDSRHSFFEEVAANSRCYAKPVRRIVAVDDEGVIAVLFFNLGDVV